MAETILVTGASGFVGKAVCRQLVREGHTVIGLVRRAGTTIDGVSEWVCEGNDFENVDEQWPRTLACDSVIHLAARVHVMNETSVDALPAYRAMNVEGTMRIARAAQRAGARRFVFVSSIKASAECSGGHPISERDRPTPIDAYGISKLEAERSLFEFGRQCDMEIVVVRPPLVYGPGVRANFLQLMRAVARGIPLPLGAIKARRSIVFVENLADAIVHCSSDPRAAGQTFHVADEPDPSVAELATMLAEQLRAPRRVWPIPPAWLRLAGRMTGRSAQVGRLIGELRLDCSHIRNTLDWHPPFTVEQGLRETAAWYRSSH
ncbi:NAD-dependent epimerase/dehydratase family protein [Trinickia sp. NRRL B-1857]|uniref:NAD-dependent epimerase/dehydratase family protein n=1 Tax=Trinickia sp. NRRL B-1857 TaxID=3162879 RepID=UPI003D2B7F52